MKLISNFEIIELGEEYVAVPIGEADGLFQGILKLNKEGKEILELLLKYGNEAKVVDSLSQKYENKYEIQKYVHNFVEELIKGNLFEN